MAQDPQDPAPGLRSDLDADKDTYRHAIRNLHAGAQRDAHSHFDHDRNANGYTVIHRNPDARPHKPAGWWRGWWLRVGLWRWG